jgi:hypothetical protein
VNGPKRSDLRRRGVVLSVWLWLLVVLPWAIIGVDLYLTGHDPARHPPWALVAVSYAVLAFLSLSAWAALRFEKLGIYGIYLVFGSNVVRLLLFERAEVALRLGVTLVLGAAFGLLVGRVWKELG